MADMRFYGSYLRFRSLDKNSGAQLMGPNNLVGTRYSIEFKVTDGKTVAWAVNPFGDEVGYFDEQNTYRLDVMRGRGWNILAVLALVGVTDFEKEDKTGYYWGEMAVFSGPHRYEKEIDTFATRVAKALIDGTRPAIDLASSSIDEMIEAQGDWLPTKKAPLPDKKKGTAFVKTSQSMSEKAIEQGRAGNKGCYFVSYLFIAVLIVCAVFLIKTLLGL